MRRPHRRSDGPRDSHRSARTLLLASALVLAGTAAAVAEPAQASGRTDLVWIVLAITGLTFLICIPIGGWFVYTGRKARALALASQQWPTTPGTVLDSGVRDITHRTKNGTSTTYRPFVRYKYTVGGVRYECDVIQFGMTDQGTLMKADAFVFERPVGAICDVHYDPADPKTATLDTSAAQARTRIIGGWIAMFAVPLVVGLVIGIIAWFAA